jgi:hypothetical protein
MSFGRFRLVLNLAFGFLLAHCTGSVVAAGPDKFFGAGQSVEAGWLQSDGCAETIISIVYIETVTKDVGGTGAADSQARLIVNVNVSDLCTGAFTSTSAEGTGQLTLSNSLNDARLLGTTAGQTLPMGAPAEAAVDLAFIATGPLQRDFLVQRSSVGNSVRFSSTDRQRMREAVATGSVKLNGVELLSGPSDRGSLFSDASVRFQRGF